MIYIKANNEIIKVYQRIIMSMKERVEWYGDIIIRKNTMIKEFILSLITCILRTTTLFL